MLKMCVSFIPSVILVVLYGAVAVGEANSFAPNYANAKVSAAYIMTLINKEPAIDNLSVEGESPVDNTSPHTLMTVVVMKVLTVHMLIFFSLF